MSAEEAPKSEAPQETVAAPATPEAERIATLERDNADLKDRLLRALAEMENLRRRAEREAQDARAYAITKFAGEIIGTADNLRRALDSAPKAESEADQEALKEAHAPFRALIDGVELTERELLKALERNGVRKRVPKGEKFDPHRDQAMFEIPNETEFAGTVLEVIQPGYIIGDRVLRPAMVGVSRGGPARPLEAAPAPAAAEPPPPPKGDRPHIDKRA